MREFWRPGALQYLILHFRTVGFMSRVRKAEPLSRRRRAPQMLLGSLERLGRRRDGDDG